MNIQVLMARERDIPMITLNLCQILTRLDIKKEKTEQVNRLENSGAQAFGTGNPEHSPQQISNSQEISLSQFTIPMNSRRSSPESTDTIAERTGIIPPKQSSSRETSSNSQYSNRKF